ncbi:MAG: hypothetical protein PSV46_16305 [Reyranella sp.]|nr:hypothetical protein [Reyranella sp.]
MKSSQVEPAKFGEFERTAFGPLARRLTSQSKNARAASVPFFGDPRDKAAVRYRKLRM